MAHEPDLAQKSRPQAADRGQRFRRSRMKESASFGEVAIYEQKQWVWWLFAALGQCVVALFAVRGPLNRIWRRLSLQLFESSIRLECVLFLHGVGPDGCRDPVSGQGSVQL